MHTLKLIWLTLVQLIRQVCRLPQMVAQAVKQRRQQGVLDGLEVERLDRIRNPEKYRGK